MSETPYRLEAAYKLRLASGSILIYACDCQTRAVSPCRDLPEPVSALKPAEGSAAASKAGEGKLQLRTAVLDLRSLFLNARI